MDIVLSLIIPIVPVCAGSGIIHLLLRTRYHWVFPAILSLLNSLFVSPTADPFSLVYFFILPVPFLYGIYFLISKRINIEQARAANGLHASRSDRD